MLWILLALACRNRTDPPLDETDVEDTNGSQETQQPEDTEEPQDTEDTDPVEGAEAVDPNIYLRRELSGELLLEFRGSGHYEAWAAGAAQKLTLEDADGVVAEGSQQEGRLVLEEELSDGTWWLRVSGTGAAVIRHRLVPETPVISSLSASSGDPGTELTIYGEHLENSWVTVGSVEPTITASSDTELAVVVPVNAHSGGVRICGSQGCAEMDFDTGATTPDHAGWSTPVDFSTLTGGVFLDRIIVRFEPNVPKGTAQSALSTAIDDWQELGFDPATNSWLVGWDVDDLGEYKTEADAVSFLNGVATVLEVIPMVPAALGTEHDMGLGNKSTKGSSGYAIAGVFEGWRLLERTDVVQGSVEVVVLDTGLRFHRDTNGNWPLDRVAWRTLDGSTFSPGELCEAGDPSADEEISFSHGTAVASILAATNNHTDTWFTTGSADAEGVLAGAGSDYLVEVWNAADTNWEINQAIRQICSTPNLPDVVNMSWASEGTNPSPSHPLSTVLPGCSTLFTLSAGNLSNPSPELDDNVHVFLMESYAPYHLIVANSGSLGSGGSNEEKVDKPNDTVQGVQVDLAAPGDIPVVKDENPYDCDDTSIPTSTAIMGGTSSSSPLVAAAAALLLSIDEPLPSGDSIGRQDALTYLLASAVDISPGWDRGTWRLDITGALLLALQDTGGLDTAVRLFTTDYNTGRLLSQEVSPFTGAFTEEAQSVATTCSQPAEVVMDPMGDLVTVLCVDGSLESYDASTLEPVGSVAIAGTVHSGTGLVASQEGWVTTLSLSSSGGVILEAHDTWAGVDFQESWDGAYTKVNGADVYGSFLSWAVSDNDKANEYGEDIVVVDLDPFYTSGAADNLFVDYSEDMGLSRDVAFYGGEIYSVHYAEQRYELACVDVGLDTYGALTSPTELWIGELYEEFGTVDLNKLFVIDAWQDGMAYVGEHDAWTFALVDLEQSLDGTNPKLIAQAWFRSGTDVADVPRVIEFAQNGAFVALATAQGGPWTLPHSASATGEAYLASTGDRMGVAVSKARGLAITPMLSVIAPRPGQPIVGEQALHVLVRDPSVSSLDFEMDDWTCSAPVVENLAWGCTLEHGMPGDLVITAQPAGWTHTVSYLL